MTLIPLSEAAAQIPGATSQTLLRRARQGRLTVYRVGRSYATTPEAVAEMVESCRVAPKGLDSGLDQPVTMRPAPSHISRPGSSETDSAQRELDAALAKLKKPKGR